MRRKADPLMRFETVDDTKEQKYLQTVIQKEAR